MKGSRMCKYIPVIILFLVMSSPAKAQEGKLDSLYNASLKSLRGNGYVVRDNVVYYKWRTYNFYSIGISRSEKDIKADEKRDEKNNTPVPFADAKTFKGLDLEYGVDYKNVFYQGEIIEGADPNTFTQIERLEYYYKDNNHVYLRGKVLEGADAATFKYHSISYNIDKNNVYYHGVALDVDPNEFTLLGSYLIGSNKVYYDGRFCGNINADSFRLLESGYATDGNIVFYREYLCNNINAGTFRVLDDNYATDGNIVIRRSSLCVGVNADSFRILGDGYASDGNIVLHDGTPMDADGPTFRKFLTSDGEGYMHNIFYFYIDKHRLYLNGRPVRGTGTNSKILGKYHLVSNNYVFYRTEHILGADAGSFITLSDSWGKDKHQVYFGNEAVEGSGSDCRILGESHMISNGKVFYCTYIIPGADTGSFTSLSFYWGKDKQRLYFRDIPVETADIATFRPIDLGEGDWFGFDKKHLFEGEKIRMVIDGNSFRHVNDFISVDNNYAYVIFHDRSHKIRVDGKTFEKVSDDKRVDYKDKKHFYVYSKGKLKKVRKLKSRK